MSSILRSLYHSIFTPKNAARHLIKSTADWHASVNNATHLIHTNPHPAANNTQNNIVLTELKSINIDISKLLNTNTILLSQLAKYYFQSQSGKQLRPLLILLIAKAIKHAPNPTTININRPLSPSILPDDYPAATNPSLDPDILPAQYRLAEITELIHTASLLHDDVIDDADVRRGKPTVHSLHGNKLSILAGDYLLSRASMYLARLQHLQVIELLASVISDLVEGEIMQFNNHCSTFQHASLIENPSIANFDSYMEKSFLKTASLMAKSCHAACLLANQPQSAHHAFTFGKHFGIAFQLVDDILDFHQYTGKPQFSDLKSGLVTAPVLFASVSNPAILDNVKCTSTLDCSAILDAVNSSNAIQTTYDFAKLHADYAAQALSSWQPSPAKSALLDLTRSVLTRTN